MVLAHSARVLGKDEVERPLFRHRVDVLEDLAAANETWLDVVITEHQLLVEIAVGYDVVVMGADKWHQIQELSWYADEAERDAAIAALPEVAVAPRPPLPVPDELALVVAVPETHGISSTHARAGRLEHMAPAARAFAERTGAWIDPPRYERWLASTR